MIPMKSVAKGHAEGLHSTSRLLVRASFAGTAASTMISPLYYLLVDRFGGGVFDVGVGYGILSLTTGALVYFIGRCSWFERNARRMVFLGFLAAGLGDLSYFIVRNTAEFFAVQALMGVSVAVLNPAWDALYSDEKDGSSARKWSAWTSGSEMAAGFAALAGAALLKLWGFAPVFGGMALLNGVAVYLSFRIMRSC